MHDFNTRYEGDLRIYASAYYVGTQEYEVSLPVTSVATATIAMERIERMITASHPTWKRDTDELRVVHRTIFLVVRYTVRDPAE